jgi:hypothetical protein
MEKTVLLFGPYTPPAPQVGDEAICLFRDADVVVYGWTVAPVPWPLCYHRGTRAFGKGILVEEELARAIRNETAAALEYWWGVSEATVCKWRRTFGIGRNGTEGSRRLRREVALGGLNSRRKDRWQDVRLWEDAELALLATHTDKEVAELTGRSLRAVAHQRQQLVEAQALSE